MPGRLMPATTMAHPVERRKVAGRSAHHVARCARLLQQRRGLKSPVAAQRQMDRAREVLQDLAALAREDREVAEWFRFWLAPGTAALDRADADGSLAELFDAAMAADAHEDLSLQRCAVDPTPDNKRRLLADLRREMARKAELAAVLEA